jgi:hypothetical protein
MPVVALSGMDSVSARLRFSARCSGIPLGAASARQPFADACFPSARNAVLGKRIREIFGVTKSIGGLRGRRLFAVCRVGRKPPAAGEIPKGNWKNGWNSVPRRHAADKTERRKIFLPGRETESAKRLDVYWEENRPAMVSRAIGTFERSSAITRNKREAKARKFRRHL